MSSEVSSFAEEASNNMLKDLQSWWEVPSIAQYVSLFRDYFNLPEIEIEELEKGFIEDTIKGPSEFIQKLLMAFLKSILASRVNAENWEVQLKRLVKRKWPGSPYNETENPFEEVEDKSFHQLRLRSKVEVLYLFCLCRLDKDDITDIMKTMDADALRVQKLGADSEGNTYWYFYGTRLYKEEIEEEKKSWNDEWEEQKQKSLEKRKRGRPSKRQSLMEKSVPADNSRKSEFMNVSGKSRWSVVCDTIEDWVNLAEKFKNSKCKDEKSLFQIIQENFLPVLNKIYEEKEKKLQEKIRQLMPTREKIVTRRETRKLRGENVDYSYAYAYDSDDNYKPHVIKDRGQRLEERKKRASEANDVQIINPLKRVKRGRPTNDSKNNSVYLPKSENVDLQSKMEKLLSNVKLHKDAWPFLYPVNEEDAPGYYEIIKDPIDLSKIESLLYQGEYDTIGDLDADFSKMVSNCELYNGEYHAYSKMAQTLRKIFRKEVAEILDSLEVAENVNADSEGSSDSQYHSSSNPSSPPLETPVVTPKEAKPKSGKKRSIRETLDLMAQASDLAVQGNIENRTSPPQKQSPVPPEVQSSTFHVPSASMPYNTASSSISNINKPPLTVTNSSFSPVNSPGQKVKKSRPIIIKTRVPETEKRTSPVQNVATTSFNAICNSNSINTMQQNSMHQSLSPKTAPVVLSAYNPTSHLNQNDLRFKNNATNAVTMQSNVCMPNGLPVVQQVLIPAGSQQIQIPNNGQFVFASAQNTVRQLNHQNFGKVMPQIVSSSPIMQVSKGGMQNLQFQTFSPNNAQAFTQVPQSPQFVNIPTYMLTNQNAMNNSPTQSVMSLQPYQLTQRQMQINGQGND